MSGSLTVTAFEGAARSVGATAVAAARSKHASVTLSATSAGSQIWAVGRDADRATPHVVDPGQTMVHEFTDATNRETFWVQKLNESTSGPGPVILGATTARPNSWQLAAVEIRPAG